MGSSQSSPLKSFQFDEWTKTWPGQKPPMEEQTRLARKLMGGCSQVLAKACFTTPAATSTAHTKFVSWKGIQVGWLLHEFLTQPPFQRLSDSGCPMWFVREVCIPHLMISLRRRNKRKDHHCSSGPLADHLPATLSRQPTIFISYTGSYTLAHFVNVLRQLNSDEFVWIDVFGVDQVAWTSRRDGEFLKFRDDFMNDLADSIKRIGRTVLIMDRWHNPMEAVGKIWVLWELFLTVSAGSRLDMMFEPLERDRFLRECFATDKNFRQVLGLLSKVNVSNATASHEADRRRIFAQMRLHGGELRVNKHASSIGY